MRPNLAHAISLHGVAFASPILVAQEHHHEAVGKEVQPDPMVEGYSVISSALYKDDLAAARKASGGLVRSDKDGAMVKHWCEDAPLW